MSLDIRTIFFDNQDPPYHLSSLEAVWRSLDQGNSPPTLIIRTLSPCVLIGASQRASDAVNLKYCLRHDFPVIRRPSEGGAVFLDGNCLVYSLVLSGRMIDEDQLLHFDRFRKSIIDGLGRWGLIAEPKDPNDILVNGKKIAGLTMTAWYSAISISGTLLLDISRHLSQAIEGVAGKYLTSLRQETGVKINPKVAAESLMLSWGKEFTLRFYDGVFNKEEILEAEKLLADKYKNEVWNRVAD